MLGANEALGRLNREIRKLQRNTKKGLGVAATMVKGRSQVRTPVDTGNLKASHYVTFGGSNKNPIAEVGTTAWYSVYVHEMIHIGHVIGEAKFLENAIRASHDDILRVIRRVVGIK